MATARPFAYNTGSTIPGTEQLGDLSIGSPLSGFTNSPQYWNGPDEDLGYVIAQTVPSGNQPNPVGGSAYVGFFRSEFLTDNSFLELSESVAGQTFVDVFEASTWLSNNGYWTSYVPPAVTPTPTPTTSVTPTSTQTMTPTPTTTLTASPTPSVTPTLTQTPTNTISPTTTPTRTVTPTPSVTPSVSPTLTQTPTTTPTPTPTKSNNLRVLMLGDGQASTVAGFISSYLTTTGNPITYSAVTMGTTYTGSGNITKANYDVVMIYTNSSQIGTTTMANALTTFVGQGGSIVSGTFLWNLYPSGYNFTGTTTFNTNAQSNPPGTYTVVSATTITNGIGSPLPTFFSNGSVPIVSGSVELAKYTDNTPLLYTRNVGSAKLVSINAFPANITSNSSPICKIFGNAILYAGGKI